MIRAPGLNGVLSAARAAKQLLARRNVFEELLELDKPAVMVAPGLASLSNSNNNSNTRDNSNSSNSNNNNTNMQPQTAPASSSSRAGAPSKPLELRDLSSSLLWLQACSKANTDFQMASSIISRDVAAATASRSIARLMSLLRLEEVLCMLGALGGLGSASPYHSFCRRKAKSWLATSLRQGMKFGLVRPGKDPGLDVKLMLRICVEDSTAELMEKEQLAKAHLLRALDIGFEGSGTLTLSESDLVGMPEELRRDWAAAGWFTGAYSAHNQKLSEGSTGRSSLCAGKYTVPTGRDSMDRIMPYCASASARQRLFEAYHQGFSAGEVNSAALDLLRVRQSLARRLGFRSWAAYELRPLAAAVREPDAARQVLDRCWQHAQPALAPMLQKMRQLAIGCSKHSAGDEVAHIEAYLRALASRESDHLKLAEFLPAEGALKRMLETVGRASNVFFRHVPGQPTGIATGWHSGVRVYEMLDGPPSAAGSARQDRRLGFVYVDLYQRRWARRQLAPGAVLIAPGHVYVGLHYQAPSYGSTKLLTPEDAITMAHEFGHAVHMLCMGGCMQEYDDLPLDVQELPSTFFEVLAAQSSVVEEYARHHASGGPPPDTLARSVQQGPQFFARKLRNLSVGLGLHSEEFDAGNASPRELQAAAVAQWQRYSPIKAHPGFSPLGEDAGMYLALGANQVAYLLCYLRADSLLHANNNSNNNTGQRGPRSKEAAKRWLSPEFATRLRSQLLDRPFPGQRLASL
ncbi:unnamed protein product, partial [Polarella glacialis]